MQRVDAPSPLPPELALALPELLGEPVLYLTPGAPARAATIAHVERPSDALVHLVVLCDGASHKPDEHARARELWACGNRVLVFRGDVPHASRVDLRSAPRAWCLRSERHLYERPAP
jgi:hypothetical protein